MNNWVEIATGRLQANFRVIRAAAGPNTEILAVVKANAYGHGAELCSRTLVAAGARWLGVTSVAEGARVRAAVGPDSGPAPEILLMCGFLPEDVPAIFQHRLTPVLWNAAQIASLRAWLQPHQRLRVHVEVDTGMGRQGVLPGHPLAELLQQLTRANLVLDGIFTHFCSAEEAASELTHRQQRLFEAAVAQLQAAALHPRWLHAGNSSSVDNPTEPANPARPSPWLAQLAATLGARPMVRTGLALFGYCLPIDGPASPVLAPALQPVLLWKASVLAVRTLAPGETVGYNATFTARSPMRIATLGVGYADGLRRELSSAGQTPRGWVVFAGRRAPILGRISMNLTTVDITDLPAVLPGSQAVILGEDITAHDHARLAGTIPYEILCGIHPCG